jgi:hypothetical protein
LRPRACDRREAEVRVEHDVADQVDAVERSFAAQVGDRRLRRAEEEI